MENYHQGDLTDIVRAGAGAGATTTGSSVGPLLSSDGLVSVNWEFPSPDPLLNSSSCTTTTTFSAALLDHHHDDNDVDDLNGGGFGDPFFHFRDPLLLHELNDAAASPPAPPPNYFSPAAPPQLLSTVGCSAGAVLDLGYSLLTGANASTTTPPPPPPTTTIGNHHHHPQQQQHSNNIFSRIQISSPKSALTASPRGSSPGFAGVSSPRIGFKKADLNNNNNGNGNMISSSKATTTSCLVENGTTTSSAGPPLQISSPRNLGIKRRKSQAKKVVCIPAPAAANSRPSGEVVPSDLWAWRKYGQKPIKGSPYPRGYYRCSSSKGCSARKQVERSRTDPNMLVITYTSEHNHPWPTQRNALAGSTRSHPHKHHHHNNNATSSSSAGSKNNNNNIKEEPGKDHAGGVSMSSNDDEDGGGGDDDSGGLLPASTNNTAGVAAAVKQEEADVDDHHDTQKQMMEMESLEMDMNHHHHHQESAEFSGGFSSDSYRPTLAAPSDFFADLREIETDDPLELLFSGGGQRKDDEKGGAAGVGLEPLFTMFDWSTSALGDNNNNIATSFGGQEAAAAGSKRD